MDDQTLKIAGLVCAIWGSVLSTLLALVKLWETFWKNRLRLAPGYRISERPEETDEITVANLSGVAVQVSGWSLAWKARCLWSSTPEIDITPNDAGNFTIPPNDSATLYFGPGAGLDFSYQNTRNYALYLTLHIFGQRCPKRLKVSVGT